MTVFCKLFGHKVDICYNSVDSSIPYRDVAGCSRCGKVWVINEKEKQK